MSDIGNEGSPMVLRKLTEREFEWDNWRRRAELAESVVAIEFRPKVEHVCRGNQQEGKGRPRPSQRHCLGMKIGGHNIGLVDSKVSEGK